MTNLIGLSCQNQFAGKLNLQDCFRYDFVFLNEKKGASTKTESKPSKYVHGQHCNCHCDEIDDLNDNEELDEIDYMLY